jgi:M3 family oligoendopeptidase
MSHHSNEIDFHAIEAPAPAYEEIVAEYRQFSAAFDEAAAPAERLAAVARWDACRRRLETWESLTNLRFNQDTRNDEYKRARDYCDELRPKLTELAVAFKRKLLGSGHRAELESHFGRQAFALWEADVLTFDPAIERELVRESKLGAEYTELLASAALEFQGRTYNLSEIVKFREDPDREIRRAAERVRWNWFAANRPALDRIFDEQVGLRHAMARRLGFENFVGLAYKRMCRVDYGQGDVERFREAVRSHVVPLAVELRQRQARRLGLERQYFWDEAIYDPRGNPAPQGDHDWLVARAQEMFDAMGGGLDDFFRLMVRGHLMDLKNRDGKAGGGFCTSFPSVGVPYIFANFNGTKGDVEVFTHEMGHAFQNYMARRQPLSDYLWPTSESAEIHSMGLEYLTWPHMEKFFGAEADRFCRIHLEQSLLFLPYGVAVDHFQHLVYSRPEATPEERHAMWRELEQAYLPWRDYGDLPHCAAGGYWQFQRHVYLHPFYYIDYTLAQTCALQFWVRSRKNPAEALEAYVQLCRRGGEAPFQELVRSAGLVSPFQPGCLMEVVAQAREVLNV